MDEEEEWEKKERAAARARRRLPAWQHDTFPKAPCPWCGRTGAIISEWVTQDNPTAPETLSGFTASCRAAVCGAAGPFRATAQEAVDAWDAQNPAEPSQWFWVAKAVGVPAGHYAKTGEGLVATSDIREALKFDTEEACQQWIEANSPPEWVAIAYPTKTARACVIKVWHGGGGVSHYLELTIGDDQFKLDYESGDKDSIVFWAEKLTAALKSAGAKTGPVSIP